MIMGNLFTRVRRFAEEKGIIQEGDSILIALSGGPDSVFLFHFLVYLSRKKGIGLKAAYVHHHLRKDADSELTFTKRLAHLHSVPFFYRNIEIGGKSGIEEEARIKRYRALYNIAKKAGCNRIAVGHTLDDQAETVVMRFIKGSGLAGLRGILPEKYLFKDKDVSVIRPLLCLEKKDILEALKREGKEYRIDRSNFSGDFLRNRIRSEVLPLLSGYNPKIKKQVAQMSFLIQDDLAFLERYAEAALNKVLNEAVGTIDVRAYKRLDISVRRLVSAILVKKITGSPYRSFSRIKQVMDYLEKSQRKILRIKDLRCIWMRSGRA
jgi:tRNA(Ile)-lysidine synthase